MPDHCQRIFPGLCPACPVALCGHSRPPQRTQRLLGACTPVPPLLHPRMLNSLYPQSHKAMFEIMAAIPCDSPFRAYRCISVRPWPRVQQVWNAVAAAVLRIAVYPPAHPVALRQKEEWTGTERQHTAVVLTVWPQPQHWNKRSHGWHKGVKETHHAHSLRQFFGFNGPDQASPAIL